ncbi:MAG: hypothetical protein U0800_00915 [Isosphaeraceae bacterium]
MPIRTTQRRGPIAGLLALGLMLVQPLSAGAGGVTWLEGVVRQAVKEARGESKAAARSTGRLFARESEESLETLAKRSDDLARLARRAEDPGTALLESRFGRLVKQDEAMAKEFKALAPAEKRLVVEMGEVAQSIARRHPEQAEDLIRGLGVDGLTAVRVYGDDVAEVLAKEGPESLNVLRKSGRPGWDVFTKVVLPNKGKLAAAGVLALFLANPDQFVDTAGNLTQYAVEQFAKAGVQLAGGIGEGPPGGWKARSPAGWNPRPERADTPMDRHGDRLAGGAGGRDGLDRPADPLDAGPGDDADEAGRRFGPFAEAGGLISRSSPR